MAKPEIQKKAVDPAPTDRLSRIESEINKIQNELKKLTTKSQTPAQTNGRPQNFSQWRESEPRTVEMTTDRHRPSNSETLPQWQNPRPHASNQVGERQIPQVPRAMEMQPVMPSSVVYSQSQNGVNGHSRFKSYQSQSLLC